MSRFNIPMPKPIRGLRSPKNECSDRWCKWHFDLHRHRRSPGSELSLQLGPDPVERPISLQMRGDEAPRRTENTQRNMLGLNCHSATQRQLSPCVKEHDPSWLTESSYYSTGIVSALWHSLVRGRSCVAALCKVIGSDAPFLQPSFYRLDAKTYRLKRAQGGATRKHPAIRSL
jgi:hypothetical protein